MIILKKFLFVFDFLFTSAVGTLLHFLFELSGQNSIAAVFGAVNESVWEHLKLLFWPVFVLSVVEYFIFFKASQNFILSRFLGLIIGMTVIVTVFYTLSGIVGNTLGWFNILLYYIAVLITFITSRLIRKNGAFEFKYSNVIGLLLFIGLAVFFGVFSFYTPNLGIFKEPS